MNKTTLLFNTKSYNDLIKYENYTLKTSFAYLCAVLYILHYSSSFVVISINLRFFLLFSTVQSSVGWHFISECCHLLLISFSINLMHHTIILISSINNEILKCLTLLNIHDTKNWMWSDQSDYKGFFIIK